MEAMAAEAIRSSLSLNTCLLFFEDLVTCKAEPTSTNLAINRQLQTLHLIRS